MVGKCDTIVGKFRGKLLDQVEGGRVSSKLSNPSPHLLAGFESTRREISLYAPVTSGLTGRLLKDVRFHATKLHQRLKILVKTGTLKNENTGGGPPPIPRKNSC